MTGLGCLTDRQQDHCVLDGLQRVPGVRYDQKITRTAFPGHLSSRQPDPAAQDLDGCLLCSSRDEPMPHRNSCTSKHRSIDYCAISTAEPRTDPFAACQAARYLVRAVNASPISWSVWSMS
jgi:hypothetical protein